MRSGLAARAALTATVMFMVAGCGFNVRSADLFLLTRTGQGKTLTLLVNDGGTIRCNGSKPRPIPDTLLIRARDLADGLAADAKRSLRIPTPSNSVYQFRVKLSSGTVRFPDTAAAHRHEVASAEQFVLLAVAGPCSKAGSRNERLGAIRGAS
jgi:hypothetical protein